MDLIQSIRSNDIDKVKILLLNDFIDINFQDENGDTALKAAVNDNNIDIVNLLLNSNKNININIQNKNAYSALIRAVDNEDIEIIKLLLNINTIDINIQNKYGHSALLRAVSNNNLEIVKLILNSNNVNTNVQDQYGYTALMWAVNKINIEIVKLLLNNNNIDINIENKIGNTALSIAASRDSYDILKLLINRYDINLNVNIKFKNIKILLKRDPVSGGVILHDVVSSKRCDVNIIRNIVNTCPYCVNISNSNNKTSLDLAIENELSVDIIATLLLYASTSSSTFALFSTNNFSSHPLYGPLVKLLQSTSYDSVVRLHLCGHDGAGKSTLRHCIEASLTNFFNSNINPIDISTIGLDITSFTDKRVKYVVFDYGGQSEYHVNHSRFLRSNSSIYVIVLNLSRFRDCDGNRLQSPVPLTTDDLSDLCDKFNYWLKFINIATPTNTINGSVCKAHVITCLNCDRSLIRSGSNIISSGIEVISNVQNWWMNRNSSLNRINFVNNCSVVNMINTESVYSKVIPLLRSMANEIPNVSVNNFKFVDNILTMRDNEKWFDIGPRSEFLSLIMSTLPSTFPNNIKIGLADAALSQLELIGEVLIFTYDDNNKQVVVTNPSKLSSGILGKLAKYLTNKKNRNKNRYFDIKDYSVTRNEILNQISPSIIYCEGVNCDVVIAILEHLGICIKCNDNNWFPVFAADRGTIRETNIFELSPEFRKFSRRVHRRYKLLDSKLEMFPQGYFSSMFVYISSMAMIEGNFQLYSNSILIPERGRIGEGGFPHMETIVKISEDRSYFDVIVQSWVHEEPLDHTVDSRYWNRLINIYHLIFHDSKFVDYFGVVIEEFLVHPDPSIATEIRILNDVNSGGSNTNNWKFGINGNKSGVNDPNLMQNDDNGLNNISSTLSDQKNNKMNPLTIKRNGNFISNRSSGPEGSSSPVKKT